MLFRINQENRELEIIKKHNDELPEHVLCRYSFSDIGLKHFKGLSIKKTKKFLFHIPAYHWDIFIKEFDAVVTLNREEHKIIKQANKEQQKQLKKRKKRGVKITKQNVFVMMEDLLARLSVLEEKIEQIFPSVS